MQSDAIPGSLGEDIGPCSPIHPGRETRRLEGPAHRRLMAQQGGTGPAVWALITASVLISPPLPPSHTHTHTHTHTSSSVLSSPSSPSPASSDSTGQVLMTRAPLHGAVFSSSELLLQR